MEYTTVLSLDDTELESDSGYLKGSAMGRKKLAIPRADSKVL